ncbi:Glutathione-dependent formaldehyde-activating enzyme [Coniochaeta hoffmannii]|uniref:Glutathione-dependent formaldehyde-activating enzyme n=1 Tax=Coniochaeta hoffmannii TaxID=91930 RepID=A0AA38RBC4_9PEZI|nr:Glutathione-dependent formaldehyde-activating enzyme [Coniochaeta hoffmannii]
MLFTLLDISCLCGRATQQITVRGGHDQRQSALDALVAYSPTPHSTSYFCATCGCHVFVCATDASTIPGHENDTEECQWAVATGTIVGGQDTEGSKPGLSSAEDQSNDVLSKWDWMHDRVPETMDGGISVWINNVSEAPSDSKAGLFVATYDTGATLPASCHCRTVRFHITRPDASSVLPESGFPDLMLPYCRTDPKIVQNPSDVKWWLCGPERTKYLAGTCACRSCRLASGFEIQAWAFVPRSNIFMHLPASPSDEAREPKKLEFESVSSATFKSYESSPGVVREFCPRCGATVFWHNTERPELIDVSVGLLEAPDGARAESWLEWWTGRVSFAEEAGEQTRGHGIASQRATSLIQSLEHGLSLRNNNG